MNHNAEKISVNRDLFAKAYNFYKKKNYDSCYVYSTKALSVSKNTNEKDILNYIQGVSAIKKNLYKKALINISAISEGDYVSLKNSKLGMIYLNIKNYKKSIFFYKKWEKNNVDTKLSLKRNAFHNLGLNYIHVKDYGNAKKYFDKELKLIQKEDTLSLIRTKMDLANAYYNQYLDDDAIPLFQEAYDLAISFSDIEVKQNSAQNMAVVERNRKRYKESVEYYEEFIKWKDSIWNRDRIWELTEKDKQLAVAQKESEIALQDEKLKRQRIVQRGLLVGAGGLLLFIGLLGFFYRKLKKKNGLITQQKEDLNIANKTKDYLFSVVSHDLRSPMNTIKFQHEELKKHITNNNLEGIKQANNTAITVTKSTSHLLNNVLHWSLQQSNQMTYSEKEYALQPIIEQVLYDYENLIEANAIEIKTNYIKNSLVKVDRESLKIVFRNLLDNAVKYMKGKGIITVEIGTDDQNMAYVSIADTGIGISQERLEKINALKGVSIDKINRSEGVGLGLILCQTLIKKNKGILTFESEEGKGTKVVIQLPVFSEQ
ncbi:tetratricopeptide repeat-containing sensor histidine kinase [Tenacibaculum agarivorans]|uniref:tetratricopeptide repeat-containing sensor histidine kinase n=1 Tax=Tenacibaculum agarivorans TaxID=1908389 RepID=UPI00094B945C|nr:tetratricopeptide repeat-containing sensor histidine kinase [Tenacibaculum agarivorans]